MATYFEQEISASNWWYAESKRVKNLPRCALHCLRHVLMMHYNSLWELSVNWMILHEMQFNTETGFPLILENCIGYHASSCSFRTSCRKVCSHGETTYTSWVRWLCFYSIVPMLLLLFCIFLYNGFIPPVLATSQCEVNQSWIRCATAHTVVSNIYLQ